MSERRVIRATDLAKFATCEQKALFEHRHGEELTPEQERRIADGNRGHARFLDQAFAADPAVQSSERKPWCFVASCVFGPAAAETRALRAFRDRVLRRSMPGRALIRLYYRRSPALARWLTPRPWASRAMRLVLLPASAASAWIVRRLG